MRQIWFDARLAVRALRRTPGFTAAAVLTLALGIGANSAIFSVVNGILLKPLPFEAPEQLVAVWHKAPGLGYDLLNQDPATYFTYRDHGRFFQDIGLWDEDDATVTGTGEPEQVDALLVTDGTLPLLGVQPQLGRLFDRQDDLPGRPLTVMLTHGYWQRKFGGDREVIGRSLDVNARPHEIIGVLAADFRFLNSHLDLLLPFQFDRSRTQMGDFSYQGVARLKPGATLEQANADVDRLIPLAVETYPGVVWNLKRAQEAGLAANLRPFQFDAVGDVGATLWVLLGTVGMVLLIACANVANLFLVRAEGRRQEMSVRVALGAGRANLVRELLSESVLLGVAAGAAGLALAFGAVELLRFLRPDRLPRLEEIGIDASVVFFTLVLSLLAGLVFGLFPVFKYSAPNLLSDLKEGGRGGSAGRGRLRVRNLLVVSQIALALVLLAGSGLMIRSLSALMNVQPGFRDPQQVLILRIPVPQAEVPDNQQAALLEEAIHRRLSGIAGVDSVGVCSSVTMDGWDSNDAVDVEEFPAPAGQIPPVRRFKWVGENYFETMGNPLLAGRTLNWNDVHTRAPVAVVTENLAREYWPSPSEALGKRIRAGLTNPWHEIVGVVGNVHDDGVDRKATAVVYWPLLMENFWGEGLFVSRSVVYALRTSRLGTPGFLEEVRRAVWSVNPNLPLAGVRTLQDLLDRSLARTSFTLVLLSVAAVAALLLGVVGIYGVVSYAVSQRTHEIGVRMALGASGRDVSRSVLGQGFLLAAAGVGLGLAGALALTRLLSAMLYGVHPVDPLTYAAVSVLFAVVALASSYLPARRAAGVNPIEALRSG